MGIDDLRCRASGVVARLDRAARNAADLALADLRQSCSANPGSGAPDQDAGTQPVGRCGHQVHIAQARQLAWLGWFAGRDISATATILCVPQCDGERRVRSRARPVLKLWNEFWNELRAESLTR